MTVIIDYGVGNLFSLKSSILYIGKEAEISSDVDIIRRADRIILPGVGAFGNAAKKLYASGLDRLVVGHAAAKKPLLGICVGMQLLFERSFEYGEYEGLGLVSGSVNSIATIIPKGYKIPHIGWNALSYTELGKNSPLLKGINEGEYVYFVHSYAGGGCNASLLATTEYGASLPAVIGQGNIFGTQFHPEKSGTVGLSILKSFCEL